VISVRGLAVTAGNFIIENVNFDIPSGGYAALMGRTGSGKTTVLEAITGLKHVKRGSIIIDDFDVTHLRPAERNIGYVPQDGALFSGMTVRDHLAFALVIRGYPRNEIALRVKELAELLEISHLLERTSVGLSGGERQRVALGRALSFRPRTLCLDEPLSALDDATRAQMYELLSHVRKQTGVTTIHVTHSLDEAQHLADLIFRIEQGRITPIDQNGPLKLNGQLAD
jgi:ABC-type sugar transport system ATPase subunit